MSPDLGGFFENRFFWRNSVNNLLKMRIRSNNCLGFQIYVSDACIS